MQNAGDVALFFMLCVSLLTSASQAAPAGAAGVTTKPGPGDTIPPAANAGPNQTVDQNTLVTFDGTGSTDNVGIVNYTWAIPDGLGPITSHFNVTVGGILMVFDPVHPYLYTLDSSELYFVNLTTGNVDEAFPFAHAAAWPMSMAISPNGNYLVVGIPTGDRGYYDFGPYLGYLAGFDLVKRTEISEFQIASDIYDVAATDDGYAIVSGGSGQWTPLQVIGLRNGTIASGSLQIWQGSPVAIHPGGSRVYSVDGEGISPASVHRFDFSTVNGVTNDQGWPYFGSDPGTALWVGRDRIVTSNGRLLRSQDNGSGDMAQLASLPVGLVTLAAFDPSLGLFVVVDYWRTLEFYDSVTYRLLGSATFDTGIDALAFRGHELDTVIGGKFVTMRLPDVFLYGPTPSSRFTDVGTYVVHLAVWDAAGNYGTSTVTITVRDTEPPHADAGVDQITIHGLPVDLDGSNSTDNVGIVDYVWTFNDSGPRVLEGRQVAYTFESIGTYRVTLTVFDAAGNTNRSTMTVTVTRDTAPPTARAGPDRTVYPGMTIVFDGSGSTDNIGIASYVWTFDDGGPKSLSGVRPSYDFGTLGTYRITLTVTDLDGNRGNSTMTVTVSDVPLVFVDHPGTYFRIGLPSGWTISPDYQLAGAGTVDVFATGASLQGSLANVFVLSGRQSVEESDAYLMSQANIAIDDLRSSDTTLVVLQSPQIIPTGNGRAATFEVSLKSGQVFQMWGIAVNQAYGRMWVIVGSSHMSDMDTYRAVFQAVIASFQIELPTWIQQYPLAFGALMAGSGAGIAAVLTWVFERRRRVRSPPPL